jgi:hypothetical protein
MWGEGEEGFLKFFCSSPQFFRVIHSLLLVIHKTSGELQDSQPFMWEIPLTKKVHSATIVLDNSLMKIRV